MTELNNLKTLDLTNNKISGISDSIQNLTSLENLYISDNEINLLPELKLFKLKILLINNNQLIKIKSSFANLKNLEKIDLSDNQIKILPQYISKLPRLEVISLEKNPLIKPPIEVTRDIENIKNYFEELNTDGVEYLNEIKIILVGKGGVGKSTLANKLINIKYEMGNEISTKGIEIKRLSLNVENLNKIFKLNIWDFGGQELYHSTHQFFLTKRSIYLLLTEARDEDRYEDFYYWLNIIKLLGGQSPIIMVHSKSDQRQKEIPVNEFRKKFKNIADFKRISNASFYSHTIQDLISSIAKLLTNKKYLPHLQSPLPKTWVYIRMVIDGIRDRGSNYISLEEYINICKEHNRDRKSALELSQFFHDIGVILHFQDDFLLKNTVFLNHHWVTKGIYNILDNEKVIRNRGKFSIKELENIWNESYFWDKHYELLALMRKFDICFEIENGKYIVPQLLSADEISYDWIKSNENIHFEYQYKFMPKGIT